ncbi:MAG: restriction endonuclease [Gammaproteobacteria bacterium]|nr:restriction endonuclease [Gammaproteobacteria bacterium]
MVSDKTDLQWLVVFRTANSDDTAGMLYKELKEGRLRQGWGGPGLALQDANGNTVGKEDWEASYEKCWNEKPSQKRYGALVKMLEIAEGDIVMLPKQPASTQFSIARVTGKYRFEESQLLEGDFGHVISVAPESVRTFDFRADTDAYAVSSLFSRANHRYPVTFAYDPEHIRAAQRLLERADNLVAKEGIVQSALDDAVMAAAQAMQKEINKWNGHRFEAAVRRAFENHGYNLKKYRSFDRKGGDADIVVSPPNNIHSLFMPQEIAVQVKWKKGIDQNDVQAVEQLVKWRESDTVQKFVISSADRFTPECKKMADDEGITLIGGLNTMYFLMGIDRVDEIE